MNIIWAIREICVGEKGIENLFDREKSYQKIIDLSDNLEDAVIFSKMLYGNAKKILIEIIHDAYNYEAYIEKLALELFNDGLKETEIAKSIEIFLETFGFPGYRNMDFSKVDTIITENGDFRYEYTGELKNGKEHGVGIKTIYYQGEWCYYYEAVWVNGIMCGYEFTKEMDFGMFEDTKIGFVTNNCLIGKTKVFASSGEDFYDIGKKLDIK